MQRLACRLVPVMIDCAVIGDSIAIGVAPYLPHCAVNAKIGIPSAAVIGRVRDAAVVIVSAGSNDPYNPELIKNLIEIRRKISGQVIWIEPINRRAAAAVHAVAGLWQDRTVTFAPGPDNVHPRAYLQLAQAIAKAIR